MAAIYGYLPEPEPAAPPPGVPPPDVPPPDVPPPDVAAALEQRSWLFTGLLSLLIAAFALILLLSAMGTTRPFHVSLGRSMQPTLWQGSLIVAQGVLVEDLRIGDIIVINTPKEARTKGGLPPTIIHRVVDIAVDDGRTAIRTKGDNETNPDPFTVSADDVVGREVLVIPRVGYVMLYLWSGPGKIALAAIVALVVIAFGLTWALRTTEEFLGESTESGGESAGSDMELSFERLAFAIGEYGEHLRSHTKVVQELAATTGQLHEATAEQRATTVALHGAVDALHTTARASNAGPSGVVAKKRDVEPSCNAQTAAGTRCVSPVKSPSRSLCGRHQNAVTRGSAVVNYQTGRKFPAAQKAEPKRAVAKIVRHPDITLADVRKPD